MSIAIGMIVIIAGGVLLAFIIKGLFLGMVEGAKMAAKHPVKFILFLAVVFGIFALMNSNGVTP